MAYNSLYPTEASMAADIKAILPTNSQMVSSLQNDLINGNLSAQDRATAQAALASYGGGTTGQYSAPIPGAPDTGPATGGAGSMFPDYTLTGQTDANMPKGQGKSMGAGAYKDFFDFFSKRMGDLALILMGIIIVAVAIWATTQKQELILKTVKSGIVG